VSELKQAAQDDGKESEVGELREKLDQARRVHLARLIELLGILDFDPKKYGWDDALALLSNRLGNRVASKEIEVGRSFEEDLIHVREQLLECLNAGQPAEWPDSLSIRHFEEWHRRQHEGPPQKPPVVSQSFLPGLGTIRECCDCKSLVAGGPTRCDRCARDVESGVSKEQSNIVKVTPKGTEEWPPGWVDYVGGKL
jgi:hypothetical protein